MKSQLKKLTVAIAAILSIATASAQAADWTESLETDSRVFRTKFKDKSVVTYRVDYSGHLNGHVREKGEPSTLLNPIDNRRCYWNGDGHILREVKVIVGGQEYVKPDLTTVFKKGHTGEGSEFILPELRSENCNDSRPRRDSDFQNLRNAVNEGLQGVIHSDIEEVKNQIRMLNDVVEVHG